MPGTGLDLGAATAGDHGQHARGWLGEFWRAAAAAALQEISDVAVDLRESVDLLVDDHVASYPKIVITAIEHATNGRCTAFACPTSAPAPRRT